MPTFDEIIEMARQDYATGGEIEIASVNEDNVGDLSRVIVGTQDDAPGWWVEARVWVGDDRFDTEGGQEER